MPCARFVVRCWIPLVVLSIVLSVNCKSPSTPSGFPSSPSPSSITVGITDARASVHVENRSYTYSISATVTVSGGGVLVDRVRVDLSRPDAQPWSLSRVYALRVGQNQSRSVAFEFPETDTSRLMASAVVVTLEYSDDEAKRGTHAFTPELRSIEVPTLAASLAPAAIQLGQSTTLQWEATSTNWVGITQVLPPSEGLPARGAMQLTPCPGQTTFRVSTSNAIGYVSKDLTVSVSRPAGMSSACGNWAGTAEGTKTDSLDGATSPFAGYITIALFQFERNRLEGRLELSKFLSDYARGSFAGAIVGDRLTGAVQYDVAASAERSTCASEVTAALSADEQELVGTYKARCIKDGRRELAYDGRFTARRSETEPYPRPR